MIRKILLSVCLLLLPCLALAQGPNTVRTFPNITGTGGIVALGAASAQYANTIVEVQGYAAANDGGGGKFQWNTTSTATADAGTIFQATGVSTGRWIRLLSNSIITPQMFGAFCNASTDDTTALQNAENSAFAGGYQFIFIGPNLCKESTLTPKPGVEHFCSPGLGGVASASGTPIPCGLTGTGTWAIDMPTTSYVATNGVQGINFHDMTIGFSNNGFRIGNPATALASQGVSFSTKIDRVSFAGHTSGNTALSLTQCFYCQVTNNNFYLPAVISYSDLFKLNDNNFQPQFATGDTQSTIKIVGNNTTFGNEDEIRHNYIGCQAFNGTSPCIIDSSQSSYISDNEIECLNSITPMTSVIDIPGPNEGSLSTYIERNQTNCSSSLATNWLSVENTNFIYRLVARDNLTTSPPMGPALFNSGNGMPIYVPGTNVGSLLIHEGNGDDSGWPWSSENTNPEAGTSAAGNLMVWKPGNEQFNVDSSNYGSSVFAKAGAYQQPAAAGGNELDFDQAPVTMTGTLDVCAKMFSTTGSQQENLISKDGGVTVNTTVETLTANPAWYCFKSHVYTTGASVSLTNTDTTHGGVVQIEAVAINQQY